MPSDSPDSALHGGHIGMSAHPACSLDLLRNVASGYDRQLLAHDDMRQGMEGRICCCGKEPIRDIMLLYKRRQHCSVPTDIMLCSYTILRGR